MDSLIQFVSETQAVLPRWVEVSLLLGGGGAMAEIIRFLRDRWRRREKIEDVLIADLKRQIQEIKHEHKAEVDELRARIILIEDQLNKERDKKQDALSKVQELTLALHEREMRIARLESEIETRNKLGEASAN